MGLFRKSAVGLAAVALSLGLATPARAQWTDEGGVLLRGTVVTMDEQGTVKKCALLVRKGKIEAILPYDAKTPKDAISVTTKGYIYPGMINLHNHIAYNFLPLYPVPKHYGNRDEWPNGKSYEALVNNPKNLVTGPEYYDRQTEALKYAEIKSLVAGETTVQGSPQDAGTANTLVRNVELKNFGDDHIGQRGLSIDQMFMKELEANQASIAKLDGWLFHLSEGIDDHARREYSNPKFDKKKNVGPNNQAGLKELGLVTKALIGIHCTALKEEDFADWKATTGEGAKIVWSPLSNLLLYGKTTDVLAARKHGATVALGSDWAPSGSKGVLWELKVADQVNKQHFSEALSDKDLVEMVTTNPAKLVKWQDKVGSIKVGMVADLVVVDDLKAANPYRNLIDAVEHQIQLVLVNGDPIYGDESWLKKLKVYNKVKSYELVKEAPGGRAKAIDLKRKGVPEGEQSLADVKKALNDALAYDPDALADKLNAGRGEGADKNWKPREDMKKWLADHLKKEGKPVPARLGDPKAEITAEDVKGFLDRKYPNRQAGLALDPIYQEGDEAYFAALEKNLHFTGPNPVFDPKKLRDYLPRTTGMTNEVPH